MLLWELIVGHGMIIPATRIVRCEGGLLIRWRVEDRAIYG